MDYEKKYKELVGKIEKAYLYAQTDSTKAVLEEIRPELKSEDERIRKELVFYLGDMPEDTELRNGVTNRDVLAWLEKQGESFDKEKVLIGARKDVALSIINYLDNNSVGMCLSNMECEDIEDACINSKWTKLYNYMKKKLEKQGDKPFDYENATIVQKDFAPKSAMEAIKEEKVDNANKVEPKFKIGDIISNGRVVYRVDGFGKNCVGNDSYFLVNVESEKDGIRYTSVCDSNGKVHNAGEIMWLCDQVDQMFQKVLEEKTEPTWSEEDSVRLQRIIDFLWYNRKGDTDTIYQQEQDIDWLKSLRDKVQSLSQPKEWSEEDERMRQYVVNDLRFVKEIADDPNYAVSVERVEKEIDWMESLKERIGG